MISWARYHEHGYEVSSRGDIRFSALHATMPDGRSIEAHYQCDVKGYNPGSSEWRAYKGRRPKGITEEFLWAGYLQLWRTWAESNPAEMDRLLSCVSLEGWVLTDRFATSPINQAHALSVLLNERLGCAS